MRKNDNVTAQYIGVNWLDPKDQPPKDGMMCIFHRKWTVDYRILFGGYSEKLGFWNRMTGKWYTKGKVDYWMPIPVLPGK